MSIFTYEYELKEDCGGDMSLCVTQIATLGGEVIERREEFISLEKAKGIQEFMNAKSK